jgi:formylmethanofuran dehydrogenase subunit E
MAGLAAVDPKGYFDIDVQALGPLVKPPRSCFLDGLQVGTGATWGKRNISFTEAEALSVRITNTRTGKTAQLRPTAKLMELLTSFKPQDLSGQADDHDDEDDHRDDPLEAIARKIALMPLEELFVIDVAKGGK